MKWAIRTSALIVALLSLGLPSHALAGWNEGVAAFKKGDLAVAAREFKAVVDTQPEWPGGHYMLGWTYLKDKKTQEAIAHLRKAYELDPDNADYQLRLGEAYVAAGRFRDAAAFLSKIDGGALGSSDQRVRLAQLKAVALSRTGQEAGALAELQKVARSKPDDAKAQYRYGTAAYNAGQTAAAVAALEKASRLDVRDARLHEAYVKALNRQGRESRGDAKLAAYQKAAAAARRLVGLESSHENLMLLGEAQLGAKDYEGAVASFESAAAKKTSDWLPHYYIGQAYTATQRYKSAEASLKQALDKTAAESDTVKIWRQLGFVYEKQKQYDAAISAYTQANDQAGITRATENKQTAEFNKGVEEEARRLQALQEEEEKLRRELEELAGGRKKDDG